MENAEQQNTVKSKSQGVGVSYPIETINQVLEDAQKIISETGTGKPISKEEISAILRKSVGTLTLYYSTLVQYGLFSLVHSRGYIPTELYRKYAEPKEDNHEAKVKLQIFKSVPLYAKIIENLNNHTLPSDEKRFANILKDEPYNVNSNSTERAARVFFQNCRDLGILVNGTLKFGVADHVKKDEPKPPAGGGQPADKDDRLIEITVPLLKGRAIVKFPEEYTDRDLDKISRIVLAYKQGSNEKEEQP